MNVIVFASRKGGTGKSTLVAHLASYLAEQSRPTLLIDTDQQKSLSLWHQVREKGQPVLKAGVREIGDTLLKARQDDIEWVLVDTPPEASAGVSEAIRQADLVIIPMRPGLFDIVAVQETVGLAHEARKPYAVVINAAPSVTARGENASVADARGALESLGIPVWHRQITHEPALSLALSHGQGAREFGSSSDAADEMAQFYRSLARIMEAFHDAGRKRTGRRLA